MYRYQYPAPYELYHHGIKGQRWGVRRFKKENGQLTPAGKKRYLTKEEKKARRREKRAEWIKPWEKASTSNKVKRVAAGIGLLLVADLITYGGKSYLKGKAYVEANNAVVDAYAKTHGLKEVQGPATLGLKQMKAGKKICDTILGG